MIKYIEFLSFIKTILIGEVFTLNTTMALTTVMIVCFFALKKACFRCQRFCPRLPLGRSLAQRVRIRNLIFLGRYFCRLRRSVRLEFRRGIHLDRSRKCFHRFAPCLEHSRQKNENHDPVALFKDNARFLRREIQFTRSQGCGFDDYLPLPYPLYRFAL